VPLFVRDRQAKRTGVVSIGAGNAIPEATSSAEVPGISDDGRYVVFMSFSGRLLCVFAGCVPAEHPEGPWRVYIRDLDAGTLRPALADVAGAPVASARPAISGDGRFVALVELEGPGSQLTIVERASGNVQRIQLPRGGFDHIQLTGDGNALVLTDGAGTDRERCLLVDRLTGSSARIDLANDGTPANGSACQPSISSDGSRVAFLSNATNLDGGAADGNVHLYVRDLASGRTERHDFDPAGRPLRALYTTAGGPAGSSPALSGNGRFVVFLVAWSATAEETILYVRDIEARTTQRVDVTAKCGNPNTAYKADAATISDDGRYIAFVSEAPNLVPGDSNGINNDVFVRDRLATCSPAAPLPSAWLADASLSARTTSRPGFGRLLLRFKVLRAGQVKVTLERRARARWRVLAWKPLGRLEPAAREFPFAQLFYRLPPPRGSYRLILTAGKTRLMLPLKVR
jgi:Tol biopolymer transport system component